jgi:catechol 2,3-dioxygenase-like lactoylglutathione lyase family enzyme
MLVDMVKIGSVVLSVRDIQRASTFWRSALGYVPGHGNDAMLIPENGEGPFLLLDAEDRTHLDLWAANAQEQQAEVERLVSLGARRVEDWVYPDDADFIVLADTEGNLLCVIDAGR